MKRLIPFLLLIAVPLFGQTVMRFPVSVPGAPAGGGSTTVYDTVKADNEDGTSFIGPQELLASGGFVSVGATALHREAGLIFQIAVPQGKTIDSAIITAYFRDNNIISNVRVKCYNVDNAAVFNATHTHEMDAHAALTIDSVTWTPYGTSATPIWMDSPNLKLIVQDVVNRAGWTSGNNIGFVLYPPNNATAIEEQWDYSQDASKGARIRVVYH